MITGIVGQCLEAVSRNFVGNDLLRYSDLVTVYGLTEQDRKEHPEIKHPYILATKRNDYLSVIEISGAKTEFDKASFDDFIERFAESTTSLFTGTGHKLSFAFERDFTKNQDELNTVYKPHVDAVNKLGLDIVDLIADDAIKIAAHYSRERGFLVLYSAKSLISKHELKDEIEEANREMNGLPASGHGQNPVEYRLDTLKISHDAVLWQLINSLSGEGNPIICSLMDVRQAGSMMRQLLWRNSASDRWYPRTPFDKGTRPRGNLKAGDLTPYTPPRLNIQLLDGDMIDHGSMTECDGKFYAALDLELPPMNEVTFKQLFKTIPRKLPYRVKFDFVGGGRKALNGKATALAFLRFIPSLKVIARDLDYVVAQNEFDPIVIMAVNFVTWGDTIQEARRNRETLKKTIESWGVSHVSTTYGNPTSALINSVPGLSMATPGTLHYPPLSEGLHMLPLERPASPWSRNSNLCFITEDGKLFPYEIASALQEKATDVYTGVPGSGKSVLANRMNLSTIFRTNGKLPFLTIIDKGYSAKGIADLLIDELPEHQRHYIAAITLNNDSNHCINIFDTQLGSRYPTQFERIFLIQMLQAMCVDPQTGLPPNANDVEQIITDLIDQVYTELEHEHANKFSNRIAIVNQALEETGLKDELGEKWFIGAKWWEIVDLLFAKNRHYEATVAQRYAVPTLATFIAVLTRKEWADKYEKVKLPAGEPVVEYIQRSFQSASKRYAIFSSPTVYDFSSETRVAILDMQNVLGDNKTPSGKLKSGIMYLFARQMAVRNYYLPQSAETFLSQLPKQYVSYHQSRINELAEEVKHTFYDECHNFAGISFIQDALNTADLEDRKFNVRTAFSSQFLEHMPSSVLKTMNSVFIMRLSQGDVKHLRDLQIDIPDDVIRRFRNMPQGAFPDGSGTAFLGIFKTRHGLVCHILKNTVGIKQLWALNSSAKDRVLRTHMYRELGGKRSRNILAKEFPLGTARGKIDDMINEQGGDAEDDSMAETMAIQLAKHLVSKAKRGEL
ncbi:conjugal transfer protein [Erwinia sp. STN24]|uniref:conjugal transfer protein n=1 Tax=Erwinia sp. STN24 TaxID=3233996 RepID=UPI0035204453